MWTRLFQKSETWTDRLSRFFETIYVNRSGHLMLFWNIHKPFKNMVMGSIAIGFRFETDQKCDIRSRVDLPVTQRGVVWTRIIGGPFKPLFLAKNGPHFQSFLIDFLAPGYALSFDVLKNTLLTGRGYPPLLQNHEIPLLVSIDVSHAVSSTSWSARITSVFFLTFINSIEIATRSLGDQPAAFVK